MPWPAFAQGPLRTRTPTPGSNSRTSLWIAGAALALPITFVALTETYRLYVIRRRQSIYAAYLSGHYPPFISLRDVVHARFATLRCWMTGRFLNVTHEWREQTIYEFLFHHLVYRPLTGRTWWRGGLSDDPAVKEATLPAEEVDTALLLRHSLRHRTVGRVQHLGDSGELQPSGSGISSSSSQNGDEDDWEKLEASRAGSLAPDSAPAPTKAAHTATDAGSDEPFEMTYTWLGQSTSLVQMGGVTLLTDPVFAAQPVESVLAPTRLRPPPLTARQLLDELRIVDVVQISHDHFDHLDEEFVRAVAACANTHAHAHAREILWVVPLGVKAFLVQRGIADAQVVEMDWWQEETVCVGPGPPDARKKLRIVCTPAQHWAGRNGLDTNRRLWCGFITRELQDGERGVAGSQPEARSFFHAGDSGYSSDLYKAIGSLHGGITLAAIPIGAYAPRHMMKYVHTDPAGAVSMHRDLRVGKSVGVHWGTWIMSDERYDDPVRELDRVLELSSPQTQAQMQMQSDQQAVSKDDFVVLPTGRTLVVG